MYFVLFHLIASNPKTPLKFYSRHGLNGVLSPDYTIVSRKNAVSQFDAATFMSNRPLQDNELFQLRIDNVMTRWNGSLQIGLTTESPASLEFPRSLVGMQQYPNWILSDSNLYIHGQRQMNCHHQGLQCLKMGDYFGISRRSNGQVHIYINGKDLGKFDYFIHSVQKIAIRFNTNLIAHIVYALNIAYHHCAALYILVNLLLYMLRPFLRPKFILRMLTANARFNICNIYINEL